MALQSAQLTMRSGPNPGKVFVITKEETMIGRDTGNDVVINDAEISRKHARIVMSAGGYVLEDLGSTNGTFVNGQRLMGPHSLTSGELIMFGENVSLSFEAPEYDAGATVIAGGGMGHVPMPEPPPYTPPQQAYTPPAQPEPQAPAFQPVQPPPPAYVGQVPQQPIPVESYRPAIPPAQPQQKGGGRTWLLAGCGCLVILLCLALVAFLLWVDQGGTARWCQFFPFLPGCR